MKTRETPGLEGVTVLDSETSGGTRAALKLPVSRGIKSAEEYPLDIQPAPSQLISTPCQDQGCCHA
jgi:hypothetical protein